MASKGRKNVLEWTVFKVSLLLVIGIICYWTCKLYNDVPAPPDLQIEKWPEPSKSNPFLYHLVIYYKGGQTAENVKVEIVLEQEGLALERAELDVAFVPEGLKREGWVNFTTNPCKAGRVVAKVMSYKKP